MTKSRRWGELGGGGGGGDETPEGDRRGVVKARGGLRPGRCRPDGAASLGPACRLLKGTIRTHCEVGDGGTPRGCRRPAPDVSLTRSRAGSEFLYPQ